MSVRAELVRLGLRYFLKPTNTPETTIVRRRQHLANFERWVPKPPAAATLKDKSLGGIPTLNITTPRADPDRRILFLHGGGYVTGSPELYRYLGWRIAEAAAAQIAIIDYRLAPEHPFPAALDDAAAAWQGLVAEGAAPDCTVVMGDSAGGGLALALCLRLRDLGEALPAAIVAMSPWTDLAVTGASIRSNAAADPMQNADDVPNLAARYLQGADPRNPYASPLYGDPTGLPPTLIQVGGDEILRDDSVRMAAQMREAGCYVEIEVWPRMPHVWQAFVGVMPEARRAVARLGAFVRQYTPCRLSDTAISGQAPDYRLAPAPAAVANLGHGAPPQ